MTTELVDGFRGFQEVVREVEQSFNESDYQETLNEAIADFETDHAEYFATGMDPNGRPWLPLEESTVAAKGHDTILVDKGDLERTLIDSSHPDAVREVASHFLGFGTSDHKAHIHQEGSSRIPQRVHVGAKEETVDELAESVADATVEKMKLKI